MFGNRSDQSNSSADTGWDKWEAFEPVSVQVVPVDPPPQDTGSHEEDLFEGMQPVVTKAAKIQLRSATSHSESISTKKFAVDTTFPPVAAELEEWTEDATSWEAAADELQGELLEQTQKTLREKKAQEREMHKQQQELLRQQRLQTLHTNASQLGVRLPTS